MSEQMAREIRDAFVVSDHAPEGAEFFKWYWVPARYEVYVVPLPSAPAKVAEDPARPSPLPVVEIRSEWRAGPARVGVSAQHHVGVVFFGGAGKVLPPHGEIITESDSAVAVQEAIGRIERRRDAWQRLADLLGLDESDEWKRDA